MCRPLVIGESATVRAAITLTQKPLTLHSIEKASDTNGNNGAIDILDMHTPDWDKVKVGRVSAECGRASMAFLEKAMQLALDREVTAVVKRPDQQEATMMAGFTGLGHLEYMAQATNTKPMPQCSLQASTLCSPDNPLFSKGSLRPRQERIYPRRLKLNRCIFPPMGIWKAGYRCSRIKSARRRRRDVWRRRN